MGTAHSCQDMLDYSSSGPSKASLQRVYSVLVNFVAEISVGC